MFAIFIFAAAYDLSAALTELPVAVRLSAMAAVATRIAPPQITIISTAAMHTLFPRWVKSVGSTRPTSSRPVRCASNSDRIGDSRQVRRLVPIAT
jgi:hypothetical protein